MSKRAIVLLSGGLDSLTTAAIARSLGFTLCALTIDYGQRHRFEIKAAQEVAQSLTVAEHMFFPLDLTQFGGSALTADVEVPKSRTTRVMASEIPITYVPARNMLFLSLALAYAEVLEIEDIFLGVNAVDYSGYPDCRPEFIRAFGHLANLATKAGVEGTLKFTIHTPLIDLAKAEIIQRGTQLGVDYALTISCYDPTDQGVSCGCCDACQLRINGFAAAGIQDPANYR